MTQITMKTDQQPGTVGGDFAALADQLIQDAWHLPPEGDQSWREQDACRIFSLDGQHDINDEPPAQEEDDAPLEPVFRAPRVVGVLLPLALATVIVFFTVAFSAPEILTARFWTAPEMRPQAATVPVSLASTAPVRTMDAPGELRPSLARDERAEAAVAVRAADNAEVRKPALQQVRHAVSDASRQARHKSGAAVRVASANSLRQPSPRARLVATRCHLLVRLILPAARQPWQSAKRRPRIGRWRRPSGTRWRPKFGQGARNIRRPAISERWNRRTEARTRFREREQRRENGGQRGG